MRRPCADNIKKFDADNSENNEGGTIAPPPPFGDVSVLLPVLNSTSKHRQQQCHNIPSSALIAAGNVALDNSHGVSEVFSSAQLMGKIAALEKEIADGEADRGRQMQYIMSMHAWASKTAVALRQMQYQCDNAHAIARASQEESARLMHALVQVQAQQEATACTVQQLEALNGTQRLCKRQSKRQKVANTTMLATTDRLEHALSSSLVKNNACDDIANNENNNTDAEPTP